MRQYYSMATEENATNITIYGDITSWAGEWSNENYGDMSAHLLSKKIEGIESGNINLYINSYGGEVAEGLAIYNALKRHKATVKTYCDGFACSAASVIFMAGDERIMGDASLLMIHNAWTYASGNAEDLRKVADDLDIMSDAAANAYRAAINIDDSKLSKLLDNETWISPQDAVDMGFATSIETYRANTMPSASARLQVMAKMQRKEESQNHVELQLDGKVIAQQIIETIKEMGETKPQDNKTVKFLSAFIAKEGVKNEK